MKRPILIELVTVQSISSTSQNKTRNVVFLNYKMLRLICFLALATLVFGQDCTNTDYEYVLDIPSNYNKRLPKVK